MATENQISNHIARQQQAVTELIKQIDALRALNEEYVALGLSGVLPPENVAVYTSLGSLETWLDTGHATNLYAVKL
jgi:hypothetical protein